MAAISALAAFRSSAAGEVLRGGAGGAATAKLVGGAASAGHQRAELARDQTQEAIDLVLAVAVTSDGGEDRRLDLVWR
jgi:hypothetical protein